MRRIIAVMAVMAVMVGTTAMPAFAAERLISYTAVCPGDNVINVSINTGALRVFQGVLGDANKLILQEARNGCEVTRSTSPY